MALNLLIIILAKYSNNANNIYYNLLKPENKKLITANRSKQSKPQKNKACDTPKASANVPENKLPKGMTPAKVIINKLITLPRNSSGTLIWISVLIKAIAVTLEHPMQINETIATR